MAVILSREELYDLVWRTRIRDLVRPFGLSEPTIKKRCSEKDIPLPNVRYWTQRGKGNQPPIPRLPPRGPGMDELVSIEPNPQRPVPIYLTEEELLGPVPDPPEFAEPLDDIRQRYLAEVGTPEVSRDLSGPHHKIRALLAEDAERKNLQIERGYAYGSDAPRFETAFEQRRLRILNALMMAVAKAGGLIKIWDHYARSTMLHIHDITIYLYLDDAAVCEKRQERRYSGEPKMTGILQLDLQRSWDQRTPDACWSDDKGGPMEVKIGAIVAEFFVQAEAAYRAFRISENSHRAYRKAAHLEWVAKAKEKAEKERVEREEMLRKARIDHLMGVSADHQRAQTIRAFVHSAADTLSPSPQLENWAAWALSVAADLDPISNGQLSETLLEIATTSLG
ncbi:hypothetical protein [Sphingobium sp. EM0848]|uniref:hypothetical protein n=1 Tax=Sphingobium sp. EM0848 TaxID=2743473 RepID=UPI00159C4118|nr:hypothetical protein [Sphingobium sp. EM0848]